MFTEIKHHRGLRVLIWHSIYQAAMNSQTPTSVTLRPPKRPPPQLPVIPPGPGRLLTIAYLEGGRRLGQGVGYLAHELGLGPDAVTKQIWELVDKEGRLLEQTDLAPEAIHNLEKKSRKLMEYALPYAFFLNCGVKVDEIF